MGEYRGRAKKGMFLDILWLSVLLPILFLLLFLPHGSGVIYYISLGFFGFFPIFLFIHLYGAIREKRLVVNDAGVFLYVGKKLRKKEYWNDIKMVASSYFPGKYPRTGFFVIGNKKLDINDRDVFGPVDILKEAFIEIASMAAERGIDVDDPLGWAPGIGNIKKIEPEDYQGKWHRVNLKNYLSGIYLMVVLTLIGAIIIMIGIFLHSDFLLTSGVTIFIISLIFLAIVLVLYFISPTEIYFDKNGLRMRFRKKEKKFQWFELSGVQCLGNMGTTLLMLKSGKSYRVTLEKNTCQALKRIWWNRWS